MVAEKIIQNIPQFLAWGTEKNGGITNMNEEVREGKSIWETMTINSICDC